MIHTTKDKFDRYCDVHPRFAKAWEALVKKAEEPFVAGQYPVDGDDIYIVAMEYDTKVKPEARIEVHRRYIDIMFIYSGEEVLAYQPWDTVKEIISEYDGEKDVMFGKMTADHTKIKMYPGNVAVFFPEDAHTNMNLNEICRVRKLLAKVAI